MLWYTQRPSIIKKIHMVKHAQLLPHMKQYIKEGNRCCFVSNVKSECEQMYEALGRYKNGVHIVTGDDHMKYEGMSFNNMTVKKMLFENIDKYLKDYDVKCLIYSPCISAGCSIENQDYKRVYAYFSNQSNSALSACQ